MIFRIIFVLVLFSSTLQAQNENDAWRITFNDNWKCYSGEIIGAQYSNFNDTGWRSVTLPHDISIEGEFSEVNPVGVHGGYLPAIQGYYRKTFYLSADKKSKMFFIDFDGVYRNSEVWINGYYLGRRPNGYISFSYPLTGHLNFGRSKNILLVKFDNSAQPGARWYTGSGIYRNVWLREKAAIYLDQWGTRVLPERLTPGMASLDIHSRVTNTKNEAMRLRYHVMIKNPRGSIVANRDFNFTVQSGSSEAAFRIKLKKPEFWSPDKPRLYQIFVQLFKGDQILDNERLSYGVRYFHFDPSLGFILNDKPFKIKGVCMHAGLGCLGAAINASAIRRQLILLKNMGANAIRTAHNPPAPELLDLCDEMGFLVVDEAFDQWKIGKTYFDYHWNWDEWHKRDLEDQILRDRMHPSVFMWSIGNEIPEQTAVHGNGGAIAKELRDIIRNMDTTRPVTSGNNYPYKDNQIIASDALDVIGINYHEDEWKSFPSYYPGKTMIATETVSALETRGIYYFPSDRIMKWNDGNNPVTTISGNLFCSAYDQEMASWGKSHEQTLKYFKKYDFVSGMFVWSGFDYLGEPTPFSWPARSSYFGILDLAGFPKDIYYLYQSEWTSKPVLHIFPHWNWTENEMVDVWAYFSQADEVELFLNGNSLGIKRKEGDAMHVMWRIAFHPGTLKAISRLHGRTILVKEIKTASAGKTIVLSADKIILHKKFGQLGFVSVKIVDDNGNTDPHSDAMIRFSIQGNASIAGVDNGNPVSHAKLNGDKINIFNGKAMVVIRPGDKKGDINLTAGADGMQSSTITMKSE